MSRKKRVFYIITKEFPLYYISRLFNLMPNHGIVCKIRGSVVSWCLGAHGKSFQLAQSPIITYPENIRVGDNVYIAHRVYINAKSGLYIDDNVTIGPNCVIATTNHKVQDGKVLNEGSEAPIKICSGTWIAGNVTLTAGVTIGKNCIIAAGSVVTKNIPDNKMAGGGSSQNY